MPYMMNKYTRAYYISTHLSRKSSITICHLKWMFGQVFVGEPYRGIRMWWLPIPELVLIGHFINIVVDHVGYLSKIIAPTNPLSCESNFIKLI